MTKSSRKGPKRSADAPAGPAPLVSVVTGKGQTTIPARLRERLELKPGTRLEWLDDGEMLLVIPLAADPILQFRGKSKATLTLNLLRERAELRNRER